MSDLLNQASLVYIPSGYKEDTAYSVIPTDGSGDLTFTRASDGTRVNSQGLVERVPWNLAQYSEQFDNAAWGKDGGVIVSANTTTAPNGTTTADTLDDQNSGSYGRISQNFVFVAGVYTYSIYIKKTSGSLTHYPGLEMCSKGTYLIFNTTTGTYVEYGGSNYTVNVENVGDYWRVSLTTTTSGGTQNIGAWPAISSNGSSISSSATGSNIFWGAQLVEGSTAKPYFPTTDRQNVPRLDYSNGCPSLLLEPQRTNLVTYSEQMDNAAWTKTLISATANQTTSPSGYDDADLIDALTGTGQHFISAASITYTNAVPYTFSVFAKKGNTSLIQLFGASGVFGSNVWATYNFDTLEVTTGSAATASMVDYGSGWYRLILTGTVTGVASVASFYAGFTNDKSVRLPSFTAANQTFYLWGAQTEQASYPTSYIPTTSATVTRVADAASKTGISSLIGQSEGVVFLDINHRFMTSYPNEYLVNLKDGTNQLWLRKESGGSNLTARLIVAGTNIWTISVNAIDGRNKIALVYKSTDSVVYLNGSQVSTSSASYSGLSLADFYFNAVGTANPETHINQAVLFPTRLTNAELASLTTL